MQKKPRPPAGLKRGGRGRRFWDEVAGAYEFRPDERELLAEACRMLDAADKLRAVVGRDGLTSTGSKGQTVVHPLLAELRSTRSELRLVFRQLGLPDAEGERDTSKSARHAAETRWGRRSA